MTDSTLKQNVTEIVEDKRVLTFNDIATKLLNDKFLLTALEFHTELIESGRELKQLKDFFSDPSNFEQHSQPEPSTCIPRSGSQATLDSLDLTRFSEDGERGTDERIAVLEFELRKARETINALRTNLTVATESEINVPEAGTPKHFDNDPVKPHEQRALNFLINEYLLSHEYKLTSITFADENENQDFDDWDDVGLNIARPAKLLTLYRHGLRHTLHDTRSVACTADIPVIDEAKDQFIANLQLEVEKLRQELSETEALKLEVENKYEVLKSSVNQISNVVDHEVEKTESHSGSDEKSLTPETFEVIGQMKSEDHHDNSVSLDEDHDSPVSFNDTDWTRVTMPSEQVNKVCESQESQEHDLHEFISTSSNDQELHELNLRKLPLRFHMELQRACKIENLITESKSQTIITPESFIDLTGDALPRIIPQMLVGARELAVPLLSACTVLSNSSRQRDTLLAQLFNLKKRPSPEERQAIISGVVNVAALAGHTITEAELLPQCWEQLSHKCTERRLLVAETCSALVPHVSSAMRSSLLMSMLQQLLGDREAAVRESAVVSLATLVSRCDDSDKYAQCEQLMLAAVVDNSTQVAAVCRTTLLPVIAQWALQIGKFDSLVKNMLKLLNEIILKNENGEDGDGVGESCLLAVRTLLPFILVYVADGTPSIEFVEQGFTIDIALPVQQLSSGLNNPSVFYHGDKNIGIILHEFYKIMKKEHTVWSQLTWFIDTVLPSLLSAIGHINVNSDLVMLSMMDLMHDMWLLFGESFTENYLRKEIGKHAEQDKGAIIAAHIAQLQPKSLGEQLGTILCSQPASLSALRPAVHWCVQHVDLREPLLAGLWTGVAQASDPAVRRTSSALFASLVADLAASREQGLLSQRVAPAAVTLASDPDTTVRYSALAVLSELVRHCGAGAVADKALLQLRSYLSEPPPFDDLSAKELSAAIAVVSPFCDQSYREDVLLPALGNLALIAAEQRRPTMASFVLDSYGAVLECRLSAHALTGSALPGLRALLTLSDIRTADFQPESVLALVREAERRASPAAIGITSPQPLTSALQQGMSRMFNARPAANFQQIFKKK